MTLESTVLTDTVNTEALIPVQVNSPTQKKLKKPNSKQAITLLGLLYGLEVGVPWNITAAKWHKTCSNS